MRRRDAGIEKCRLSKLMSDGTYSFCSPEGIRTLVADLRSQSPGPLDDGAPVFSIPHDLAVIGTY